ncbi:MAG: hypothetical protein K6T85_18850, partial [Gorillibacterium sp.]|nr:hypothetical protein [Gorillibacterium sp.]
MNKKWLAVAAIVVVMALAVVISRSAKNGKQAAVSVQESPLATILASVSPKAGVTETGIKQVTANNDSIGLYEKLELTIDLSAQYD